MKKFILTAGLATFFLQFMAPDLSVAAAVTQFPSNEHKKNLIQVNALDDLKRKAQEKKQREAFADMMDQAHLGFNPSAEATEKASSRLGFEIGLNRSGYELSGLRKLLELGAKQDSALISNLLFQAQEYNDLALIKILLDNGADINIADKRGFTVLQRSIGYNHTDIALELINRGANLTGLNDLGMTPLMSAAQQGDLEVVNALIKAGADVNYTHDGGYGEQDALYWAYRSGDREVVTALIDAGANKDKRYDALSTKPDLNGPRKCSESTRLCPDRTNRVRRSGSSCEFQACPESEEMEQLDIVKGTFSEIDAKISKDAISTLNNGTQEQKDKVIADIKSAPGKYNPAALKSLSRILFARIEDKEGAFWFIAADLRYRYDIFICKGQRRVNFDIGVPQFKPYAQLNPDVMKELYDKVMDWDVATPYEYDHRWVTIGNGVNGYKLTDPIPEQVCIPKENWESAKQHNRDEYASVFRPYTQSFDYRAMPKSVDEKISESDFKKLLEKAEKGDGKAQYELATMRLLPKEFIEGDVKEFKRKWLVASAKQENIAALYTLGQQYVLGMNIPKEQIEERFQEGKLLLIKAGQKGNLQAFGTLGGYYLSKGQPVEAYAWYSLDEIMQQRLNPKLQMFPSKKKKEELEMTLASADLQAAKALAQEYIQKYGEGIK